MFVLKGTRRIVEKVNGKWELTGRETDVIATSPILTHSLRKMEVEYETCYEKTWIEEVKDND